MPTADPTRDALYAAVLEAPDDDVPRLVLSDWLEEHGDAADHALAEFIRWQCRLARMQEWDEGFVEGKARAARLLAEHGEAWRPDGLDHRRWAFWAWDYERGFPSRLRFSDDDPQADVHRCFTSLPITRADFVYRRWSDQTISIRYLDTEEIAARVRELALETNVRPVPPEVVDVACRAVSRCSHLTNLRRLRLPEDPPSPPALAEFLAAPLCRRLTKLDVWAPGYQDEHFRRVAAVNLPDLAELRAGLELTPDGAAALAAATWFPRLTALDLTANPRLGDDGLAVLLAGARDRLRSLELWNCDLGGSEWAALAEHGPASLVHLNVGHNHGSARYLPRLGAGAYGLESLRSTTNVGPGEHTVAPRLFAGPALAGLRRLDWVGNRLGDDGLAALTHAPFRDSLRILILRGLNDLTDTGLRAFWAAPWPQLAHLDLDDNPISPEAALVLVEHPNLARLVSLRLRITNRAHVFVKGLAKSPAAARLHALHLDCGLTAGAVKALVESPHLEGLQALNVTDRLATKDRQRLHQRFGPRLRHRLDPLLS